MRNFSGVTFRYQTGDIVMDHYCAFLVLQGQGSYRDWHGRHHALAPGVVAQHLPDRKHAIERNPQQPYAECSISFSRGLFERSVEMGIIDPELPTFSPGAPQMFCGRFLRLQQGLMQALPLQMTGLVLEAQQLLLALLQRHRRRQTDYSLEHVLAFAAQSLSQDSRAELDLHELAAECRMSYIHFRRCFQARIGESPGRFRLKHRMAIARELLAGNEYTVTQVALILGYADVFTFSRQFKKITGVTPSHLSK
jgi:AraC-like DNA-binding protein